MKLDPSTGVQLLLQAQCFDRAEPEQISLDMEFGTEGKELARRPTRSCCTRR